MFLRFPWRGETSTNHPLQKKQYPLKSHWQKYHRRPLAFRTPNADRKATAGEPTQVAPQRSGRELASPHPHSAPPRATPPRGGARTASGLRAEVSEFESRRPLDGAALTLLAARRKKGKVTSELWRCCPALLGEWTRTGKNRSISERIATVRGGAGSEAGRRCWEAGPSECSRGWRGALAVRALGRRLGPALLALDARRLTFNTGGSEAWPPAGWSLV